MQTLFKIIQTHISAQDPLSAVKRSSSNIFYIHTNIPMSMYVYILRKGEAKNKRFPTRKLQNENDDDDTEIALEMEKDDWEKEPDKHAFIRSLWHMHM